tara:strand:+ start:2920 stop:3888 length:969 start_codon:yes stop_codon:yes gene_type:complete
MLNNKKILITGATGSFGKEFVKYLVTNYANIKKLVIFSRDELKQSEMSKIYNVKKYPFIRFFIGDIRDKDRIYMALKDIDYVIHAAALKQVDTSEYNPFETVKTNIIGTQNIIEACLNNKVKKMIALSTDKAVSPFNLYGATKLCAEKLVISANNIKGKNPISFSIVRYGNVLSSRGSVVPIFLEQKKSKTLTITDKEMTRFNISLKESINLVLWSLKNSLGGEIFIPKLHSFKITDLAKAICQNCKIKYIGTRKGEKIHEELISEYESEYLYDFGKYYGILNPEDRRLKKKTKTKRFSYNSKDNKDFLNVNQIKKILSKNV